MTYNHVTDWIEKKMTTEFHRLITVRRGGLLSDVRLTILRLGMVEESCVVGAKYGRYNDCHNEQYTR